MSTERRGPQRFLVLELLDSEVLLFLASLREAFGGSIRSSIHITVRGPYTECIKAGDVKRYEHLIEGTTILLRGFGTFVNPDESVVYLRAHNNRLKKVWWKPDFPQDRFGFNPHISILKTKDQEHARKVWEFLNRQGIELECKRFHLVSLTSKQGELFRLTPPFEAAIDQQLYCPTAVVRPDVIREAAKLAATYRTRESKAG